METNKNVSNIVLILHISSLIEEIKQVCMILNTDLKCIHTKINAIFTDVN